MATKKGGLGKGLDSLIVNKNEGVVLAGECNKILESANETITKVLNKDGKLEKFEIDK